MRCRECGNQTAFHRPPCSALGPEVAAAFRGAGEGQWLSTREVAAVLREPPNSVRMTAHNTVLRDYRLPKSMPWVGVEQPETGNVTAWMHERALAQWVARFRPDLLVDFVEHPAGIVQLCWCGGVPKKGHKKCDACLRRDKKAKGALRRKYGVVAMKWGPLAWCEETPGIPKSLPPVDLESVQNGWYASFQRAVRKG